jgi:predicted tellurium resistance membrane protein TerC
MRAPGRTRELLVALFLLGVLLLVPPLLLVFNKAARILGIPTLYLYLFVVWAALIALVALVVERRRAADEVEAGAEMPPTEPAPSAEGASDA